MMKTQEDANIAVSVVVCAYNEEKRLDDCIKSLDEQDFGGDRFEVLVIDDESTDRTPEIAHRWAAEHEGGPTIRYYRIKHNGLSVARNTGIHYARGEIIAFIDGDARADKSWLRNLVAPFDTDDRVMIVGGQVENLNNESAFARFVYRAHYRAAVMSSRKLRMTGANMAFRRQVFDVTGGFFNLFERYGDETSVVLSFFKARPDCMEAYAEDAIVFNEHPGKLWQWLAQRYYQGRMQCLIALNISQTANRSSIVLKSSGKSLSLAFYPTLMVQLFIQGPWLTLTPFLVAWCVRHVNISAYFREVYRQVRGTYGVVMGMFGILLALLGQIFGDMGYIVEGIRIQKGKRINLAHSVGEVTKAL